MQRVRKQVLHSALDLIQFLGCLHRTTLDLLHLVTPHPRAPQRRARDADTAEGHRARPGLPLALKRRHARLAEIEVGPRGTDRAADLERFYCPRGRRSEFGYLSPIQFDEKTMALALPGESRELIAAQ